jgi:hypothetical protein
MVEKFRVTREIHEWKTIERPRVTEKIYCAQCGEETNWLLPEEAMAVAGVSLRAIFRSIESRDIHFAETANGFLIVCVESLADLGGLRLEHVIKE